MQFLRILLFILFFFIGIGFCDIKREEEKWKKNCINWTKKIRKIVGELSQNAPNLEDDAEQIIINRLDELKEKATKLATKIMAQHHTNLLKPLIAHHAQKIANFCKNLKMGGADEHGKPPNLLIRLQERIVSISTRTDQLQRMVNTTFVDFRAIWQLINNVSINASALIDELIEQLAEKVSEMQVQVTKGRKQNSYPTYYNDIEPFNEAETNLKRLTENNGQLSNEQQMNRIKKIVSKMWAKANLNMLKNVSDDLLEGNSYFFGLTILFEFGKQMLVAERMIYKGFLNETTLGEATKRQLINAYKQLMEKSVALYKRWKLNRVMRLENIGIKLKREMAALNLSAADHSWDQFLSGAENETEYLFKANTSLRQATIKSGTLIDKLFEVENLFSKYQYELDMVDLSESANIMWHKLDEANQLIKAIKFAFFEDEELEVYDALLECLDIDELLKHIESESDQMTNKELL